MCRFYALVVRTGEGGGGRAGRPRPCVDCEWRGETRAKLSRQFRVQLHHHGWRVARRHRSRVARVTISGRRDSDYAAVASAVGTQTRATTRVPGLSQWASLASVPRRGADRGGGGRHRRHILWSRTRALLCCFCWCCCCCDYGHVPWTPEISTMCVSGVPGDAGKP